MSIAFDSIKKHKGLFGMIILLQLALIISAAALGTHYLLKIVEDTKGVIEPIEQANYDSQKIEGGEPFIPDYSNVYNSYYSMLKNVAYFALGMAVLFLVLNGLIWLLSHQLLEARRKLTSKEAGQFFLKIWAAVLLLFGPLTTVFYFLLIYIIRISESFTQVLWALKLILAVKLVLYYFMLAAFASALEPSWKNFANKAISLSIRKIAKTFPLFLITIAVLTIVLLVLYGAIEYIESIMPDSLLMVILLLLLGMLSIVTIVFIRLFWIATTKEIEKN